MFPVWASRTSCRCVEPLWAEGNRQSFRCVHTLPTSHSLTTLRTRLRSSYFPLDIDLDCCSSAPSLGYFSSSPDRAGSEAIEVRTLFPLGSGVLRGRQRRSFDQTSTLAEARARLQCTYTMPYRIGTILKTVLISHLRLRLSECRCRPRRCSFVGGSLCMGRKNSENHSISCAEKLCRPKGAPPEDTPTGMIGLIQTDYTSDGDIYESFRKTSHLRQCCAY